MLTTVVSYLIVAVLMASGGFILNYVRTYKQRRREKALQEAKFNEYKLRLDVEYAKKWREEMDYLKGLSTVERLRHIAEKVKEKEKK